MTSRVGPLAMDAPATTYSDERLYAVALCGGF
jgi:hypothetical protein